MNAPQDVGKLIDRRPSSHRPGSFPREYLPVGEAVLYESRPAFGVFAGPAILGNSLLILLAAFAWVALIPLGLPGDFGLPGALLELLLALVIFLATLGIIFAVLRWFFTAYAVTNRRIAMSTGIVGRTIVDTRLDRIQCTTLTQAWGERARGIGTLLFGLSAVATVSPFSGTRAGGILWRGVIEPVQVKRFVEDIAETFGRLDRAGQHVLLEEE